MGNVSLFIAALCHAKNLPELKTWFRNIIILEWEGGKLDNYVGNSRIVKNALILVNGNKITFHMSVEPIPDMGTTAYSGATWRATIQALSRRVVISY